MATIDLSRLRVGDGVLSDYTLTELSTSSFIKSLSTFSEEHFRGLLSLKVINNDSGIVTVCTDGFAFFLKLLLFRVYGRSEIKATLNCDRHTMSIAFDLQGVKIDLDGLSEIAERSGFSIDTGDFAINLIAKVKRTHALRVYAGDTEALIRTLYAVFFMNK